MTGEELRALVADAENESGDWAYLLAPLRAFAAGAGTDDLVDAEAFGLVLDEVTIRLAQECAIELLGNPEDASAALKFLRKDARHGQG